MINHFSTSLFSKNEQIEKLSIEVSLGQYADSLKHLLLGHRTAQTLLISDSLLEVHNNLISPEIVRIKAAKANAHELLYNFEAALEIYNELIVILESNQFIEEEIDICLSLARVYEWVNKPNLCQESLDRALQLIETHNKPEKLSRYYVRSSSYQRIYKDESLAREYAAKGVQLGQQYNVHRSIADGSLLLGILTEDFDESIGHFQNASRGFLQLGDFIGSKFQDMNIAKKYIGQGDYEEAVKIIKAVERYTETIDDNDRIYYQLKIRIAEISERIYNEQGEKDSVINALQQNSKYTKLLGDIVNNEKINQLVFDNKIRYEKQKLDTAERENKYLIALLVGLLSIVWLLTILYLKNKEQRVEIEKQSQTISEQYNKVEQLYNYQTTLLSEVHHRIKNNLQLIKSLLTLQKTKSNNEVESEMLDMLNHRVSSISLIHEQLYNTKEFDKINVDQYVKDLLKNFNTLLSEQSIVIKHQVEDIALNLETITPLGLIWSELISNSIKYNKGNPDLKILLQLTKYDHIFHMNYSDSGIGYADGQFKSNQQGMGFIIISSLSKQLAAESKAYNDDGAHYHMKFKEKIISPL